MEISQSGIIKKKAWKTLQQNTESDWSSDDELPLNQLILQSANIGETHIRDLLNEINPMEGNLHDNNNDINEWINEENYEQNVSSDEQESEEEINLNQTPTNSVERVKHDDALKSLNICLRWAEENNASFEQIMIVKELRVMSLQLMNKNVKQTSIKDYFK